MGVSEIRKGTSAFSVSILPHNNKAGQPMRRVEFIDEFVRLFLCVQKYGVGVSAAFRKSEEIVKARCRLPISGTAFHLLPA